MSARQFHSTSRNNVAISFVRETGSQESRQFINEWLVRKPSLWSPHFPFQPSHFNKEAKWQRKTIGFWLSMADLWTSRIFQVGIMARPSLKETWRIYSLMPCMNCSTVDFLFGISIANFLNMKSIQMKTCYHYGLLRQWKSYWKKPLLKQRPWHNTVAGNDERRLRNCTAIFSK